MDWRRRRRATSTFSIFVFPHEFFFVFFFFVALWHCSRSIFQLQDQQRRGSDRCQQTQVRISQEPAPWLPLQVRPQSRSGIYIYVYISSSFCIFLSFSSWTWEWECLRCVWFMALLGWGRRSSVVWPNSLEVPLVCSIWGWDGSICNPNSVGTVFCGLVPKSPTSWF